MNIIVNQDLKAPKSLDYTSARPGEYNVLNTPDHLFTQLGPEKYWEQINKPFLDSVIYRGDNIVLATDPRGKNVLYRPLVEDVKEITGFGREYEYLTSKGYSYDPQTGYMKRE